MHFKSTSHKLQYNHHSNDKVSKKDISNKIIFFSTRYAFHQLFVLSKVVGKCHLRSIGNRTSYRPILSVIILLINKSLVWLQNWTPVSPIIITNWLVRASSILDVTHVVGLILEIICVQCFVFCFVVVVFFFKNPKSNFWTKHVCHLTVNRSV